MFFERGILKHFAKFTRKHLCPNLLLRPATLLKKTCEFYEIFKNTIFIDGFRVTAYGPFKKAYQKQVYVSKNDRVLTSLTLKPTTYRLHRAVNSASNNIPAFNSQQQTPSKRVILKQLLGVTLLSLCLF